MSNQRFTDFPSATNAQLTDIVLAVQGYSSPTVLGTSVQETLQQVYDLFHLNLVQVHSGNPNGFVAGTTFNFCWDSVEKILYVCTTSGTTTTAVWSKAITLTAGSGITISQNGNVIEISASSSGVSWNTIDASAQLAVNNGYVADGASLITLTLPVDSSVGDQIRVMGLGAGGWSIIQNLGQNIIIGNRTSTTTSGSVSSTAPNDSIELICTVANTTWQTNSGPQGILTIV